jgi:hypothetical protein
MRGWRRIFGAVALVVMGAAGVAQAHGVVVRTGVAYRPRPVARTAAVVGTAAVTAAVVGSVVATLPPACTSTMVGNVVYQHCGSTWYQPRYYGSQVNYVVVSPPQ